MGNPFVSISNQCWPAAACVAFALFIGPSGARAGGTCDVPGQFPTLAAALADPNCAVIQISEGRFAPQVITRAVSLVGAGPAGTSIIGDLSTPALVVDGSGAALTIESIRLEAGNGPEPVLLTINGGQIASASNLEVGRISPLFADGFEGITP